VLRPCRRQLSHRLGKAFLGVVAAEFASGCLEASKQWPLATCNASQRPAVDGLGGLFLEVEVSRVELASLFQAGPICGSPAIDGTVRASVEEARAKAIVLSGAMLRDTGGKFWNNGQWQLRVTKICALTTAGRCGA